MVSSTILIYLDSGAFSDWAPDPLLDPRIPRRPEMGQFRAIPRLGAGVRRVPLPRLPSAPGPEFGGSPSNAFTWQHALISLREISICVSLLLVFYCKC